MPVEIVEHERRVDRAEATIPPPVSIVTGSLDGLEPSKSPRLDQRDLYEVDLSEPELSEVPLAPEVIYPAYKVNRTVFRVPLVFAVVPGLIYKRIINLLNWLHPFEKLDRSFTELKSLHFKVGGLSDPQSTREGRSIIDHEIRKGTRKTLPGEKKDYQVLSQTIQKFSTGFSDIDLIGTNGKLISEDPTFSRAIAQAEGMSRKVAVGAHPFLNDQTKADLLQKDDIDIDHFDYNMDETLQSKLPEKEDHSVEDYMSAYLAMDTTDKEPTKVHLFRGYVTSLFREFPEDSRQCHIEIAHLLTVKSKHANLTGPHKKTANQRMMEIIADWAGMSVEEAFGSLDVSNPISVFQTMMIHHVMSPDNKDESKLVPEIFQADGSYKGDMKEHRVIRLFPQENGFARMVI